MTVVGKTNNVLTDVETGHRLVAKNPESVTYDADGNHPLRSQFVTLEPGQAQGEQRPHPLQQRRQRSHPRTRTELSHQRPPRAHRPILPGIQR
jgi:hypothetical protein